MENKIREPFDPNKKDYKSINEIENIIDTTGAKLSDEKVYAAIENFQNSDNLINYPNIDSFCEQEEKEKSK